MTSTPERRVLQAGLAALALAALSLPAAGTPGTDSLAAARAALDKRDGISAEVDLRRALDAGVARDEVAAMMGEAKRLQGDTDAADKWLEPGQFARGQREYGFHMLGRLKLAEGDYDAADKAFERALAFSRGDAETWVDIGRLRYRTGEQDQAIEASLTALKRDPKNPRALEFRGQLVRDSQGFAASLPFFARGLQASPDDLQLLGAYAATLGELGRAKDMLRVTRQMIKLDPHNSRAFFLQAVLAARAGDDNLARRLLWKVGNAFDDVPASLLLNGILELRAGNNALAVQDLAELARMQPGNRRAQELFARALHANGDDREVIARFAGPARRDDASPYLMTLVGRAYEALGDRAAAAPFLDRAAQPRDTRIALLATSEQDELTLFRYGDDPFRLDAAVPRVRDQLAAGDIQGALAVSARLGERYAGSADYQTLAGDVALAAGDLGGALDHYRAVAKIRRSLLLVERMVTALQQLGRDEEADALARNFLAEHPQSRDAAELVGNLAARRGDWRRARVIYSWLLGTNPGARDPQSHLMLALAEIRTGAPQEALANAGAAYRMQRANGRAAWLLGQLLAQAGGHDGEARALLAKAEAMGAGSDSLFALR